MHVSSGAMCSHKNTLVNGKVWDEDSAAAACGNDNKGLMYPYARSKAAAEKIVLAANGKGESQCYKRSKQLLYIMIMSFLQDSQQSHFDRTTYLVMVTSPLH